MDDYTKFLDKIELATSGNIPEQTSQKKKNNLYMTSAALKTTSLETLHKNKISL